MNSLAEELNQALSGTVADALLSEMGRRMYFPKGIISQSAEADARAHRFNATIGMAYEGGQPLILDAIQGAMPGLSPREAVAYAPTAGVLELRELWLGELHRKNPSLAGHPLSLPVVVPGLTAAISALVDLFLNPGDEILLPDLSWPNYRLIIEERGRAQVVGYPLFSADSQAFNTAGFEAGLRESAQRSKAAGRGAKAACILNFPNNPTGYSPSLAEAKAIVEALHRLASEGIALLVIADDAYFGLQYEENLLEESIFSRLAACHPNILAVKADGPTKEDYVWGFRLGFISFASAGMQAAAYDALVKKLMGLIRSSVSSSSAPAQYLILKALKAKETAGQQQAFREILASRYRQLRSFLSAAGLPPCLRPLPFNSGYFMSIECLGFSAETLRRRLLDEEGIGLVSIQDRYLRVAYSGIEASDIAELFTAIGKAALALAESVKN